MSNGITRRRFITRSAVVGTLLTDAALRRAPARPGANESISLGFVGCGRRGNQLLDAFLEVGGIRVAAVCDVNDPRAAAMREKLGGKPDQIHDYRKLLERRDIDAVVIAVDAHWHCLPMVEACQAGKDVYIEKPLAWSVREGRIMVEAARKYDRVAMIGTQQRNMTMFQEAVEFIHSGRLGKVSKVEMWNIQNIAPEGFGNPPDGDPPAGLDWDFWLGAAPDARFNPNRYGENFSIWFWDYGGGYVTEWGVHLHDITHWAMKEDQPLSVCATGGRFTTKDNTDMPDTIDVLFEYKSFTAQYFHRRGNGRHLWNEQRYGQVFYGDQGTLFINRSGWEVVPEPVDWYAPPDRRKPRFAAVKHGPSPENGPHQRMFLESVRAHRPPPTADVEMGQRSTIPGLLANISYRVGRKLVWDAGQETIKDDPQAAKMLTREYRKPWTLPSL